MKKIALSMIVALSIFACNVNAQDKPLHEVYSMLMYNFIKYVQWPTQHNEFVIGVIGNDEIYQTMSKWYSGSKYGTSTVVVKRVSSTENLSQLQVVFLDRSKSSEFGSVNAKLKGHDTLVITDKAGLGAKGSSINFKVVNNKLKFELNQKAVTEAGLKASSALASMAILI